MTMGAMAITRESIAPVSQVVQPRLEPPATTKRAMFAMSSRPLESSSSASIARTALFTMAPRGSHSALPVSR